MRLVREFTDADILQMRARFADAAPFPHLVIDDFLSDGAKSSLGEFPTPDWRHWNAFSEGFQREKRYCNDIAQIPAPYSQLIVECSQPTFLTALESLTSIDQLIVDPYLEGGGLHCSGGGGVLVPHTDFHLYERLNLYRKLNLLIYLNDDWGPDDGAYLELYRPEEKTPAVTIAPHFGRAVIFKTDDQSVHGFSVPVAQGKWRKSVALYYYNSRDESAFAGDQTTYWRSRGTGMRGLRLAAFQGLNFTSRMFSKLAHRINPYG
jgi:hypothetical protein